jgi:type I restriction enzyme M protein
LGSTNLEIAENLKNNISYVDLLDMLTFDRAEFKKDISLSVKNKVRFEKIWDTENLVFLSEIAEIKKGTTITKENTDRGDIPVIAGGQEPAYYHNQANREKNVITVSASGAYAGFVNYFEKPIFASDCNTITSNDENKISTKLIYLFLKSIQNEIYRLQRGQAQPHVYADDLAKIKLPFPTLDMQKKIVSEIEVLEAKEKKEKEEIEKGKETIINLFNQLESKADKTVRLSDENIFHISIGNRVLKNEFVQNGRIPVYSANVIEPFGNINKLLIEDFSKPSVLWGIDGDWMVNHLSKGYPFYPTDHCGVLRVKDNSINEKYLAFILEKEGKAFEFSRTKRASIDRIQGIKIPVPPLSEQKKIVSEIENIEAKIKVLETELASIPKDEEAILKKYL